MAMELDMTESAVFEICTEGNQAKFAKHTPRRVEKMCSHFKHGKKKAPAAILSAQRRGEHE